MEKTMFDIISLIIAIISMIAGVVATIYSIKSYAKSSSEFNFSATFSERREVVIVTREEKVYKSSDSSSKNSNDEFLPIIYGLGVFIVYAITLYYFLKYKAEILGVIFGVLVVGLVITSVFWLITKRIGEYPLKWHHLLFWILLFLPLVIINYSLFSTESYKSVEEIILQSNGNGIVTIVWALFDTNKFEILYLTLKLLGTLLFIPIIYINFLYLSRSLKYRGSAIKSYVVSFVTIYLIQILFTTGVLAAIISKMTNYSG